MTYSGTYAKEIIVVNPMNELHKAYFIELTKSAEEPVFWVACNYNEDWVWEFYLESNSDYERVKFAVMDMIFKCDTMTELLDTLGATFEDNFCAVHAEKTNDCKCNGHCEKHCCDSEYIN